MASQATVDNPLAFPIWGVCLDGVAPRERFNSRKESLNEPACVVRVSLAVEFFNCL